MIVEDMERIGVKLPDLPLNGEIPKFRKSLLEIDYAVLITKALFKQMAA